VTGLPSLREVPLPGMPATEPLWAVCIHTRHSIEIVAKPDREAAGKQASGINEWLEAVSRYPDFDAKVAAGLITWTGAEVIEWPYSPDEHVEDLVRQQRRDEEGQ
jgi:hypothetical protein